MSEIPSSIPTLSKFDPRQVKWQFRAIKDIRCNFDYSQGLHEVLLSGAVGSAKSIFMAHVIVTHCLLYPGAHFGIGRLTMPALKKTLLDVILKHMGDEVYYIHNKVEGIIRLPDFHSQISCWSWKDLNYQKFRSNEFSGFAFEELTENPSNEVYREVKMRLGRLSHVPECLLMAATNPDDPDSHWVYNDLILPFEKAKSA
jgi:hypothetical protein